MVISFANPHQPVPLRGLIDTGSAGSVFSVDVLLSIGITPEPSDLLRKGETIFKEKFKGMNFNEEEWLDILLENPKLIERPIVIRGNKAVVGRPLENVKELVG